MHGMQASAALAHFRFRAAALLEVLARRGGATAAPAAAAALALGTPTLLRALGKAAGGSGGGGDSGGGSGGGDAAWRARLQALVSKHVARCGRVCTSAGLGAVLAKLLACTPLTNMHAHLPQFLLSLLSFFTQDPGSKHLPSAAGRQKRGQR